MIPSRIIWIITVSFLSSLMAPIFAEFHMISIPQMARELMTTDHMVQQTFAVYMLGSALSGVFFGPVSDCIGRRTPMLVGVFIAGVSTAVCALSTHVSWVLWARFFQGVGTSGVVVTVIAQDRDLLSGKDLRVLYSITAFLFPFLIGLMPAVGSFLHYVYHSWRILFWFMFGYACVSFVMLWLFCPGQTPKHGFRRLAWKPLFEGIYQVILNRSFRMNVAVFSSMMFILMAFLTVSPILFKSVWLLSSKNVGWIQLVFCGTWLLGSVSNYLMVKRLASSDVLMIGVSLNLLGFSLMLLFYFIWGGKPWAFILPMLLVYFSITMVFANTFVHCLTLFSKHTGSASACMRLSQFLSATLGATVMAVISEPDQLNFAWIAFFLSWVMLVLVYYLRKHQNLNLNG